MAGVYISFPFCAQKCTYCNFASGVFPKALESDYLNALRCEISAHGWTWTPETVYVGGGTPSRWDELAQALDLIPGRPWKESTLEAAPGDVTPERALAWKSAGINRVSFGVQSFNQKELAQTGRKHTAQIVADEVAMLRSIGIDNINLDLIAGLPFQTLESFRHSLDWIRRLDVPHVSVYMLEVDTDSHLGNEVILGGGRYGANKLPSDEDIVAMYEAAIAELGQAGVERYEISNFAKPGWESMHNMKYWMLEPYAGFGVDAHSFDGKRRNQNSDSVADYVRLCCEKSNACTEVVEADVEEERFLVGLRLKHGVTLSEAEWTKREPQLARFLEEGLLQRTNGRLRFTDQGFLYSNEVLQEFI